MEAFLSYFDSILLSFSKVNSESSSLDKSIVVEDTDGDRVGGGCKKGGGRGGEKLNCCTNNITRRKPC